MAFAVPIFSEGFGQIRQVKVYWADTAPLKGANFNRDNEIMLQTTPNIPMEKKP